MPVGMRWILRDGSEPNLIAPGNFLLTSSMCASRFWSMVNSAVAERRGTAQSSLGTCLMTLMLDAFPHERLSQRGSHSPRHWTSDPTPADQCLLVSDHSRMSKSSTGDHRMFQVRYFLPVLVSPSRILVITPTRHTSSPVSDSSGRTTSLWYFSRYFFMRSLNCHLSNSSVRCGSPGTPMDSNTEASVRV